MGAESLIGLRPFEWLGKRSYSLYLWHWPILIIAAEHEAKSSLPLGDNLLLLALAMAVSMATYRLVENPIRHLRLPSRQSVGGGITLVVITVLVLTFQIASGAGGVASAQVIPAANSQVVLNQVAAAARMSKVPSPIEPSLSLASGDYGGNYESDTCQADLSQASEKICQLGDPQGQRLMVVYGDSHAIMWLPAFDGLAKAAHWRLVVLGKPYCPAADIVVKNPPGIGKPDGPYLACDAWHKWAMSKIVRLNPNMLVISSQNAYSPYSKENTHAHKGQRVYAHWRQGVTQLLTSLQGAKINTVILGNIPLLSQSSPKCLAAHTSNVQACSSLVQAALPMVDLVDRSVAKRMKIAYIDPTQWFCSHVCSAVIGSYIVYLDRYHVTSTYAKYLQNALAQSLGVLPAK